MKREDFIASLGVFVVAVPLSVGIAVASGASATAGLVSGIVGGIVVGMLSGAPLLVSGPAAGLVALCFEIVQRFGILGLAVATVIAGCAQMLLGFAGAGRVFKLMPRGVLSGMLAAIGVMIAVGQLHAFVAEQGVSSFYGNVLLLGQNIKKLGSDNVAAWSAFTLGGAAICVQLLWTRFAARLSWIPGALVAVTTVTLASLVVFSDVPRVQFDGLAGGAMFSVQGALDLFASDSAGVLIVTALGLAIVASAETLLTARAVESLRTTDGHPVPKAHLNRELVAQGLGNTVTGFLGGIPMTGVIVRSAANINFGARTRWSAVMHGVWILLFCLALPAVLRSIPLAVLASVLVVTGVKLLGVRDVKRLWQEERRQAVLWLVTFVSILATNLLTGLAISTAFALVIFLPQLLARKAPLGEVPVDGTAFGEDKSLTSPP